MRPTTTAKTPRQALVAAVATLGLLAACGQATDDGPADRDLTGPPGGTISQVEPASLGSPGTNSSGQSDDPGATKPPSEVCSSTGYEAGPPSLGGAEGIAEVEATVELLVHGAMNCDSPRLIARAIADSTVLTFGTTRPEWILDVPDEKFVRYLPLAILLTDTTPVDLPAEDSTTWAWPAAFGPDATDADWQEVVDSGLHTQEEVDQMRDFGQGYTGIRIGILDDGTWQFFLAGD